MMNFLLSCHVCVMHRLGELYEEIYVDVTRFTSIQRIRFF